MLDTESWKKLISGLIDATERGSLHWDRTKSSGAYGGLTAHQKSAFSSLMDQRVLRADLNDTTYELKSDSFGRAPYELAVWLTNKKQKQPIGTISSSTQVHQRDSYLINSDLERLFRKADSSIEDPEELVNRLLGELGSD